MSSSTAKDAPTQRRLRYLRALARQTGTSFTLPDTRCQASRQIAALQARIPSPALQPPLDHTLAREIARELQAIRIADAEILEERRRESEDASEVARGERALREQEALIAAGVDPDEVVRVWENW